MSKYEPLEHYLRQRTTNEVPMSFADIEAVIGDDLPNAANTHRAWWSNNPSNNVMTKSWLAAGFITERVDMGSRKLVFRRQGGPRPSPSSVSLTPPATTGPRQAKPGIIDALRARLAGTVTIQPGVDLTEPTGEKWDAEG